MSEGFRVLLAKPRGFCAGVDRAIAIVEQALQRYGAPVFVRHEVVHNRRVIAELRAKGAVFVESFEQLPPGAVVIFSAHGVAQAVRRKAQQRGFRVLDATCPLVTKVHREVKRLHAEGFTIVMIGHRGHPEVEGTMGQVPDRIYLVERLEDVARLPDLGARIAYVTQTTLSVDDTAEIVAALQSRFPALRAPAKDDICYATQNRQEAVKRLAAIASLILVIGSANSSNSNRLREVAEAAGARAFLIEDAAAIDPAWLKGVTCLGVTAGASAPESLVVEVLQRLQTLGASEILEMAGVEERVRFSLPRELTHES